MNLVSAFNEEWKRRSDHECKEIADRTAESLGVKFHKIVVNEEDLAADFEEAAWASEQHYFDLGFVAKHTLSRFTRDVGLKVVLNGKTLKVPVLLHLPLSLSGVVGQGADEFLGGYSSYLADFLSESDHSWVQKGLNKAKRLQKLGEVESTLHKPRTMYSPAPAYAQVHDRIPFSTWTEGYGESDAQVTLDEIVDERIRELMRTKWHPLNSALYTWYKCHLPNLLLTCIGDRTEMSSSIEGRTPFLDHHVVEYVNTLPPSLKIRYNSKTDQLVEKYVLREASKPFITDELYLRKKHVSSSTPIHAPYKLIRVFASHTPRQSSIQ